MLHSLWRYIRKSLNSLRHSDASAKVGYTRRSLRPLALIVDDDPDIAPLVKVALGPYAISSQVVHDGAAALARLHADSFNLVILDLAMAGLNGFDVLRALKKETQLRKIPVIVLTANTNDESLARSFGYGADDFVAKPFKARELGMRAYRLLYPPAAV